MGVGGASPVTERAAELLDLLPGGSTLVDGIEFVVAWARANSLWPLVYGTACCAMEMMSAGSSRHDWARFGVEVARATPRQADLIVLAGTIVEKMARNLVTLYEQMPGPKYVIAMGSCAISGGPFYYDSYSVIKGGDRLVPVDVYVPGCPPRPEALLYGIMELQKKIRTEGRRNPWRVGALHREPVVDLVSFARTWWCQKTEGPSPPTPLPGTGEGSRNKGAEAAKPVRVARPSYPEVAPSVRPSRGLDHAGLLAAVQARFPDVVPADAAAATAPVLEVAVTAERRRELVVFLRDDPALALDYPLQLTVVDWPDQGKMEVQLQLMSLGHGHKLFVRCTVDRDAPVIDSITDIFPAADWHEREAYDLFGVRFSGHPDPRRIFLLDDFPGHPLRKDFADPNRLIPRPY